MKRALNNGLSKVENIVQIVEDRLKLLSIGLMLEL